MGPTNYLSRPGTAEENYNTPRSFKSTDNLRGAGQEMPMSRLGKPLTRDSEASQDIVGSTQLFVGDEMHLVPMPSPDPKDPLNLPEWRKWVAVLALSVFGALALASEFIIGALTPVFMLEYSGLDPKLLVTLDLQGLSPPGEVDLNPFKLLAGLGGPPLWKVSLLSSLPLLMNGVASYLLVPLSIAVGRRPVMLFVGVMAWGGGFWASFSTSLDSHLAARAFQGLGAGAVEALIPLIVQDMMFIHQRNKAISLISAGQGVFVVSLGIASPVIVARLSWRWVYWLTAGVGVVSWFLLIAFVPETRFFRSDAELAGKKVYALRHGENRPRLDAKQFGPRNNAVDFGLFTVPMAWGRAKRSVWDTLKTCLFPNIMWVVLVNSVFISAQGAAGQVGSAVLIAAGWKFERLGLAVVPVVIASPFVWLFGGFFADKISNWHAKRNGGRREPEAHLLSLGLPLLCGIVGPILFGYAGENVKTTPTIVLLIAIFLIGFSYLTANTLFSVYLVESYPGHAGPVLVNVSSLRLMIGFAMAFDATTWVEHIGFMKCFSIYAGVQAALTLGLPLVYFYGKRIRRWTGGKLARDASYIQEVGEAESETEAPTLTRVATSGKMEGGWPVPPSHRR